jgi:histidinol-phosphate aminotransferase
MFDINKIVRENVIKLTPYSCARDEFMGNEGVFLDANENPFGRLNRYPDPYQRELKTAISKIKGIEEEKIFLGNGSDEVIDLCFRVFCNPCIDKVLLFSPTYGMYSVSASVNDVEVINVPLNDNFQIDMEKVKPFLSDESIKLIFVCSPNNPTGNSINTADIQYLLESFSGMVIIDEAYIDFSGKPSMIGMLKKYQNMIVMQTFSKAMGLAAVRIGMAFMDTALIDFFNKMKAPYNISTINQRAALKKLTETEKNKNKIEFIKNERARLATSIEKIGIIEKVYPSDANFMLVKVKDATKIYNYLIRHNIIVRNRTSIVNNCLRITVGTAMENNRLIKALKSFSL